MGAARGRRRAGDEARRPGHPPVQGRHAAGRRTADDAAQDEGDPRRGAGEAGGPARHGGALSTAAHAAPLWAVDGPAPWTKGCGVCRRTYDATSWDALPAVDTLPPA